MSVNRTRFREIFIFIGRERGEVMREVGRLLISKHSVYIVFAGANPDTRVHTRVYRKGSGGATSSHS